MPLSELAKTFQATLPVDPYEPSKRDQFTARSQSFSNSIGGSTDSVSASSSRAFPIPLAPPPRPPQAQRSTVEKFGFHFVGEWRAFFSSDRNDRVGIDLDKTLFLCSQIKKMNTFQLELKPLFDATTRARWNAESSSDSLNDHCHSSSRTSSVSSKHPSVEI